MVDETEYLVSDSYTLPGGRNAAIVYVKDGANYVARSFYKSNSSSSWRMLPNYVLNSNGKISWYGKAFGEDSFNSPIFPIT